MVRTDDTCKGARKGNKNINEDQIINWDDVDFNIKDETINYRKQMEKEFKSLLV